MNSKLMRGAEEVVPNPADLVESLRDLGYTLPTALADLIDNSLFAGASVIQCTICSAGDRSHLAVLDNGTGMGKKALINAMRMGTVGPAASRLQNDLGRFGLGLKTASLSQGRKVSVITKLQGESGLICRCWDLSHIQRTRRWQLLDDLTEVAAQYQRKIREMDSGTAIVIEDLDRATFLRVNPDQIHEHLGRTLEKVRRHLEMVFHRFIEDGVEIKLGSTKVKAWDPFLKSKSTKLPKEKLQLKGQFIEITPYVLPHHSKLTDEEHAQAAGPNGWNAHQGFYIYRCRRLIVPGTWLDLNLRKEEHFKLARIRVDLPNNLDTEWHLNVMKSHVASPAFLRDEFRRIANDVRRQASEVYRYRGERVVQNKCSSQIYIWKREEIRTGVRYRINKNHPVVQSLLNAGCGHDVLLRDLIAIIEGTIPVANMLQDQAGAIEGSIERITPAEIESLVDLLIYAEQYLIRTGKPPDKARDAVLSAEPFIRFQEPLLKRLGRRARPN